MFEVEISKETIKEVERYLEDGNLVQDMNTIAVDFAAMAFIVDAIYKAVDSAKKKLQENEENGEE